MFIPLPSVDNAYRSFLPLNMYFTPYIITLSFTVFLCNCLMPHSISILSFFSLKKHHTTQHEFLGLKAQNLMEKSKHVLTTRESFSLV